MNNIEFNHVMNEAPEWFFSNSEIDEDEEYVNETEIEYLDVDDYNEDEIIKPLKKQKKEEVLERDMYDDIVIYGWEPVSVTEEDEEDY